MEKLRALAAHAAALGLTVMLSLAAVGCRGKGQFLAPSFAPIDGIRGVIGFFIDDGAQKTRASYSIDLAKGKTSIARAPLEITYSNGSMFKNEYFVIPINSWCEENPPLGTKLEPLRSPDGIKGVMCRGGSGTAHLSLEPGIERNIVLGRECPVLKGMYWSPDATSLVLVCGFQLKAADPTRLALVNVANLELKAWTNLPKGLTVCNITWSSDSHFVAVLAENSGLDKSAIFETLTHHPIPINSYNMLIYGKGKPFPVLTLKLARDVRYGFCGLVNWR